MALVLGLTPRHDYRWPSDVAGMLGLVDGRRERLHSQCYAIETAVFTLAGIATVAGAGVPAGPVTVALVVARNFGRRRALRRCLAEMEAFVAAAEQEMKDRG